MLQYYPFPVHENISETRLSFTSLDSDWENTDMIHDTS